MAGHWPRFFAFWLTLISSRSYPVCKRLFMRGFRFRSSQARTACVVDKRDGWVLAKFFFFFSRFHGPRRPGYQRFILPCDYELRRPQAEDTSGEAARKNLWYPGYLDLWKRKNLVSQYPAITLVMNACFSRRSLFKTWPKPETAREKPLIQGRTGPRRSQGQSKRKKKRGQYPAITLGQQCVF